MLFNHPRETADNLLKQFRLQVTTELQELNIVLQWFEKIAQPLLPDKCFWQCQLALSEGFTNTVLYAHPHLSHATPIDLEVSFFSQHLEIRIWNFGMPFDMAAKLDLLAKNKVDPLDQESDRGLFFMKQLTDGLHYIREEDHRNCLIMEKKIPND